MPDEHTDPIALFDAAVAALNREDWTAVAALCDEASLAAFRRQMLAQLDPALLEQYAITAETILRHSPDMPREVAEYQAAQHRRHGDPARRLAEELPGVADADALRAMSPRDVFAAWLDGRSPRRQITRLAAEGRIPPAAVDRLRDTTLAIHTHVAIGAVHDGERIAHVLYRHADDAAPAADGAAPGSADALPDDERELALELAARGYPQVATCRRQPDGSWRLVAGWGFLGVGGLLVGHLAEEDGPAPDAG